MVASTAISSVFAGSIQPFDGRADIGAPQRLAGPKRDHGHQLIARERLLLRFELDVRDGLPLVLIGEREKRIPAQREEHGQTDPPAQPG